MEWYELRKLAGASSLSDVSNVITSTYILLPQQPNLNVIERKFKRQILKPDPIILACYVLLSQGWAQMPASGGEEVSHVCFLQNDLPFHE